VQHLVLPGRFRLQPGGGIAAIALESVLGVDFVRGRWLLGGESGVVAGLKVEAVVGGFAVGDTTPRQAWISGRPPMLSLQPEPHIANVLLTAGKA